MSPQAKDSAIFFPGLAWTAFEKLGDKVKPEDVSRLALPCEMHEGALARPGGTCMGLHPLRAGEQQRWPTLGRTQAG